MICLQPARLKPGFRICAAVSLGFWLLATGFCSTACLGLDGDSQAGWAHLEPAAAPGGHAHDSDQHDDSFCVSLRSLCPTTAGPVLTKPDFGLAFTLDFISTTPLAARAQPAAIISRPLPDGDRVFTPEVCLGPAFHSLAPPVPA